MKLSLRWFLVAFAFVSLGHAEAQNGYIQNLSLPRYVTAGVNMPLSMWARNASTTPLPSFSIRWKVDGGAWHNGTTINVTPPGLSQNSYVPHTHQTPLNVAQGPHTLVVEILSTNDSDPTNNTVTLDFTALNSWAEKVVLLEARTETWCPQCPPSNTVTNTMMTNPDFAVVKFHLSDALDACPECITYYNQHNINYTPAGIIEMGEYGSYAINANHNTWLDAMTSRSAGVAPVELTMSSTINTTTRLLTVTLTAEFTYAVDGPHALNVYVAEDNVAGPQQNAPSNYIHNRVMRAMLGGVTGTTGVVPNTPVVGEPYSQTYTYTVPAGYDLDELHLVGVVETRAGGFSDRYALNSVNRSASGVGIHELSLGGGRMEAFPNPFNQELRVQVADVTGNAVVEMIAMDGRVALQHNIVLSSMSSSPIDLSGVSLPAGAYVLCIRTAEGTAEQRVIKMD